MMDEIMWPPEMVEREKRVREFFAERDSLRFLRLEWPCDTGRGEDATMSTACIWTSIDENNGLGYPVHIEALDNPQMIEYVVQDMERRLSREQRERLFTKRNGHKRKKGG